jgi:hypothetical protein
VCAYDPEVHHAAPRCLISLHEKASGAELDGEGIQAWLEWDWGELCAFDQRQNEIALREGYRVLSSYPVGRECVWVITEADRSVTTILLPEEY